MYICTNCSYVTISKLWRCPECQEFGTLERQEKAKKQRTEWVTIKTNTQRQDKFYKISNTEIERVFTNWIKSSWVYLLAWQPWVWKSTIMLQILESIKEEVSIWYFSWEEENTAISSRFSRIFWKNQNFNIYHWTILEDILETIKVDDIQIFVIDSIQTIYSNEISWVAWSISQVKYCSEKLSEFSKKNNTACILIGHITKSWEIAWPKYLEHIVDMVAYLEWDRLNEYRFLRTQKNRFGWTDDVAIFQMTDKWLIPVYNLKQMVTENLSNSPWNILTIGIDNGRAVLTSLEVLLNKTKYKFPKRSTIWVDSNRVEMLIAILEKYLKIDFSFLDVFINIPWEFRFYDSWLDLAIVAGLLSAYKNTTNSSNMVFVWEISLSWKISKSKFHEKRRKESQGLEFVDFEQIDDIAKLLNYFW